MHGAPCRAGVSAVASNIADIKAFGQVEIELDRGRLPLAPEGVFDFQVDFRTIECAAAFVNITLQTFGLNS